VQALDQVEAGVAGRTGFDPGDHRVEGGADAIVADLAQASMRSARPDSSGISSSMRSCKARTTPVVSRSREVSNGR
jgi:hypothetical protein